MARTFGSYGPGSGQLDEPFGMAVDPLNDDLIVLDTNNHRLVRYSPAGTLLLVWGWGVADGRTQALQQCLRHCSGGISGVGRGQLAFDEGVAIDSYPNSPAFRDIYVVDLTNHRIEKFSPDGRFLLEFGMRGSGAGQFEFPVEGAAIDVGPAGILYIGDRNRIEEFSPSGIYLGHIALRPRLQGASGELGGVSCLRVDSSGNIFVVRNGVSGVREYGPHGEQKLTIDDKGQPAGPEGPTPTLALTSDGRIFVDELLDGQHSISEYNRSGWKIASFDAGEPDALHGIVYSPQRGWLYALDTNGNTKPPTARVRILLPPDPGPFSSSLLIAWLSAW